MSAPLDLRAPASRFRSSGARRFAAGALLAWIGLTLPLAALDPARRPDQYQFAEWNVSHGIPYASVRALHQTADGFLWVGTRGGLARFDGLNFVAYTKANLPELTEDEVFAFAEDAAGALWVGTAHGVLLHRAGHWWRPPALGAFATQAVRWIERDGDAMLFATGDGIFRFAGEQVGRVPLPAGVSFNHLRWVSRHGDDGWIIAAQPAWWVRNGQAVLVQDEQRRLVQEIWSALPIAEGGWWLGTESGLYRFRDGHAAHQPAVAGVPVHSVRSLLRDRDGNLWIGTRGDLLRHGATGTAVVERPGVDTIANFLVLLEDRDGNLWGGTDTGLTLFNDVKAVTVGRSDGLPARSVVSVLATRTGEIWAALWGGGLARLSATGRLERSYRATDGLASDAVWNLAEGPDGALWFAYYNQGIGRLLGNQLAHFECPPACGPRLRDLKVDRAGTVWLSSWANGLFQWRDGRITAVALPGVTETHALLVDRAGHLWISWRRGLGRFSPETGQWLEQHAFDGEGDITKLIEDAQGGVWALRDGMTVHRLRAGAARTYTFPAWVGRLTYSGVYAQDALWVNFRNGIARVPLASFAAADNGGELVFDFLTESDGLRSLAPNVFAGQGAAAGPDGSLYFATSKGVAVIDPARIRKTTRPPTVVVDRVIVDKHTRHPGDLQNLVPGRGEVEIHFTALGLANAAQNRFRHRLLPLEPAWADAGTKRVAYYGGLPPGDYRFEVLAANADRVWSPAPAVCTFRLPPHYYQTWWFYTLLALATPLLGWACVRWYEAGLLRERQALARGVAERTAALDESNRRLSEQVAETTRQAADLAASEERYRRLNAELEHRVRDRTEALAASNRELEAFSYSVSHDLRAPLRNIAGFAELLHRQLRDRLSGTHAHYLDLVNQESLRLGHLIDALLVFSRLSRTELARNPCDLGRIVESVRAEVGAGLEHRAITWRIAPLPVVPGDATLVRQVFANLLGNAVKFTRGREPAVIEVGVDAPAAGAAPRAETVVFVRDNGAGFDPALAGKLFGVFQRLHSTKEFEGTGIGLANVKRIVQRHGGRVWAEGRPGAGATFYVAFPHDPAGPAAG